MYMNIMQAYEMYTENQEKTSVKHAIIILLWPLDGDHKKQLAL